MFALITTAIIATCEGWGGRIHREITSIALRDLSRNSVAKKYLRDHLGDSDSIIRASSWADTDEAASAYPGSEDLHFSHTPWRQCSDFNMTRDCGFEGSGRCIVSGIADFAMIAIDHHQPVSRRVDAIKFLLHLVGDIHQPLHTGFAEDNGGVNIQLATEPVLSLHQMWDYAIWETSGIATRSHELGYQPVDVSLDGRISSRDSFIRFGSALASESTSMLTCAFAYRNENGSFIRSKQILSKEYLSSRRALIASRIELAGRRLANLISVIATTFAASGAEGARPALIAPVTTEPVRSRNLFEVLPIEFEPDDYIETVGPEVAIEDPSPSRPQKPKKKPQKVAYDPTKGQSVEPERIGRTLLSDITLVKRRERFIVTCRSLIATFANSDDYDPIFVHHFRVRFSKNRKRTEPIVFLADATCIGPPLGQQDFLKILYFLSGNELSQVPEVSGGPVSVYAGINKDMLDIAPIHGEYVSRSKKTGRFVRGWNPLYLDNPAPVRGYLDFIQLSHLEDQINQLQWATARSMSIEDKWDLDFFSKLRDIVVYRHERLQVIVSRPTLTNTDLIEMRFVIYHCVAKAAEDHHERRPGSLGEDPSFTALIDTNIFDGFITDRIVRGLSSLIRRTTVIDPVLLARPTFLAEILDVESILNGQGPFRTEQFRAIRGFYMIPSASTRYIAYIEWTIIPTLLKRKD